MIKEICEVNTKFHSTFVIQPFVILLIFSGTSLIKLLKEGCLTRAIPCKNYFLHSAIPPRIFGVEQKFWYLGISTARDLHAEHVFKFRKVDRVPYPRPPTEKHFLRWSLFSMCRVTIQFSHRKTQEDTLFVCFRQVLSIECVSIPNNYVRCRSPVGNVSIYCGSETI